MRFSNNYAKLEIISRNYHPIHCNNLYRLISRSSTRDVRRPADLWAPRGRAPALRRGILKSLRATCLRLPSGVGSCGKRLVCRLPHSSGLAWRESPLRFSCRLFPSRETSNCGPRCASHVPSRRKTCARPFVVSQSSPGTRSHCRILICVCRGLCGCSLFVFCLVFAVSASSGGSCCLEFQLCLRWFPCFCAFFFRSSVASLGFFLLVCVTRGFPFFSYSVCGVGFPLLGSWMPGRSEMSAVSVCCALSRVRVPSRLSGIAAAVRVCEVLLSASHRARPPTSLVCLTAIWVPQSSCSCLLVGLSKSVRRNLGSGPSCSGMP